MTAFENLPNVLRAEQVSQVLGISRAGAYRLLHSEGFPTLRIGKRMLVPRDKLAEWIERNTVTPAENTFVVLE